MPTVVGNPTFTISPNTTVLQFGDVCVLEVRNNDSTVWTEVSRTTYTTTLELQTLFISTGFWDGVHIVTTPTGITFGCRPDVDVGSIRVRDLTTPAGLSSTYNKPTCCPTPGSVITAAPTIVGTYSAPTPTRTVFSGSTGVLSVTPRYGSLDTNVPLTDPLVIGGHTFTPASAAWASFLVFDDPSGKNGAYFFAPPTATPTTVGYAISGNGQYLFVLLLTLFDDEVRVFERSGATWTYIEKFSCAHRHFNITSSSVLNTVVASDDGTAVLIQSVLYHKVGGAWSITLDVPYYTGGMISGSADFQTVQFPRPSVGSTAVVGGLFYNVAGVWNNQFASTNTALRAGVSATGLSMFEYDGTWIQRRRRATATSNWSAADLFVATSGVTSHIACDDSGDTVAWLSGSTLRIFGPPAQGWTARTSGTANNINDVIYAGSQFVAVGSTNTVLTSTTGATWTSRIGAGADWNGITSTGTLFVSVGSGGAIATSTGAVSWSSRTSGTTNTLNAVSWGNGSIVAVGASGTITTSADGTVWFVRTSGTTTAFNGVASSPSLHVAVGDGGTIRTSPTGATWTSRTSGTTNILRSVAWAGSQFVAVGDGGTIRTSTDGVTWTTRSSGTTASLRNVSGGSTTTFRAVGSGGLVLTSTDGITWSQETVGAATWAASSAYSSLVSVLVGDGGTIFTLTQGVTNEEQLSVTFTGAGVKSNLVMSGDGVRVFVVANNVQRLYTRSDQTWTATHNFNYSSATWTSDRNCTYFVGISSSPSPQATQLFFYDGSTMAAQRVFDFASATDGNSTWNTWRFTRSPGQQGTSRMVDSGAYANRIFITQTKNPILENDVVKIVEGGCIIDESSGVVPGVGVPGPAGVSGLNGCSLKWESDWQTGFNYEFLTGGDPCYTSLVTHNDLVYITKQEHTSTTDSEPGVGSQWITYWDIFSTGQAGLQWAGTWANGTNYKKNAVILSPISGTGWVCMDDHTSAEGDPDRGDPGGSSVESFYWEKMQDFTKALPPEEKTFIEGLMDGVVDWWKDAPLWERVLGVAAGIGLAYAGNKIVDALTKTGDPEPGQDEAESRYTGSPGYAGAYNTPTLRSVVGSVLEFAGFTSDQYDVTMLEEKPVHFSITGGLDARALLSQLALTYQFDVVPSGGKVKFVPKYQMPVRNLTFDDLGHTVIDDNMSGPVPYTARRLQGIDLPRSITFNYYSNALDHNVFSQVAELFTYDEGQDVVLSVPFTLEDEEAKRIVETTLANAHIEQQEFTFTTDYHNIDLEPGDVITIPVGDGSSTAQVRIKEVNETEDGILEFRCSRADYSTESYLSSGVAVSTPPSQPTNVPVSLGYSDTLFIEVPPLNSEETKPRIVGVTTGYGRAGWPGANIYKSIDGGSTYQFVATNSNPPSWGIVTTPTPAPSKGYFVWDDNTSITVQLKEGVLSNAEELGVLNGQNWAMVGEELVGFVNAQLTGPKTYTLTRLLRGRRGSEVKCGSHLANELFVLLDQSIVELEIPLSDLKRVQKFKTVTIGSSLDKVDPVDVQPAGVNLIPWAPGHTKIVKDGQDFVITWVERPRLNNSLQDDRELVHDADWGGFGVTIFTDNTATAVKRSAIQVVNNYRYTAAMQVQDFGSVQTTLKVSVVQLSQTMGGGYPAVVQI